MLIDLPEASLNTVNAVLVFESEPSLMDGLPNIWMSLSQILIGLP